MLQARRASRLGRAGNKPGMCLRGDCGHAYRLVQLTAARNNQQESLEAERATCEQHRAAIAELAEEALAAKVSIPVPHLIMGHQLAPYADPFVHRPKVKVKSAIPHEGTLALPAIGCLAHTHESMQGVLRSARYDGLTAH